MSDCSGFLVLSSRIGIAWNNPSLSGGSGPGESGSGFGTLPLRSANLEEFGFEGASLPSRGRSEGGYSGASDLVGSFE